MQLYRFLPSFFLALNVCLIKLALEIFLFNTQIELNTTNECSFCHFPFRFFRIFRSTFTLTHRTYGSITMNLLETGLTGLKKKFKNITLVAGSKITAKAGNILHYILTI